MTDVFPENNHLMQAHHTEHIVHLVVHLAVRHTVLLGSLYVNESVLDLHWADFNLAS